MSPRPPCNARRAGPARPPHPWLGGLAAATLALACSEPSSDTTPPPALVRELTGIDPDVAAAIEQARSEVRRQPSGATWGALGMTYHANSMNALAAASYEEARELEPEKARWPYLIGLVEVRRGRDEDAIRAFQEARELDRQYAPIEWRLGLALFDVGRLAEAERAFRASIRIDPSDPPAWIGLARVHLQRRDPEQALRELDEALQLRPNDRYAHGLRGAALRMQERWDEARRELELARDAAPILRDPWHDQMMRHLADTFQTRWADASTHYEARRYDRAVPLLEALLAERPDHLTVAQILADAYTRLGRLHEALTTYERCLELEPDSRAALLGLAEVHGRLGETDRALEVIDRALELHPTSGRLHHMAGVLKKRAGDETGAIESFRRSLELDERNAATFASIGSLELDLYRWGDAAASFEQAIENGFAPGEVWVGLAKARLKLDDVAGARAALERALADPPADVRALRDVQADLRRAEDGAGGGA